MRSDFECLVRGEGGFHVAGSRFKLARREGEGLTRRRGARGGRVKEVAQYVHCTPVRHVICASDFTLNCVGQNDGVEL